MAASIFHGAPGSFKSASAVWFEVLPALRSGRLVVTNIEGILPKEDIENELNEIFPDSAQVWRLSSQNEVGQLLWRNWFHWMPCGALVVIDEVQDVYPTETTAFKPDSCDYKHISNYVDTLPPDWVTYHFNILDSYKPDDLNSGDTDDLGQQLFNEHGHIIYPKTLKECYMRHRKYNWDIICCTPDITSVHKYIRNVSQYAYAHKYFDNLEAIPYFKRRPRIHEHNPKLDGKTPNKADPKKWRKIPIEVHKCYKSTATKSITKATGRNFLLSPVFAFPILMVCLCIVYFFLYFTGYFDAVDTQQEAAKVDTKTIEKGARTSVDNVSSPARTDEPVFVNLPYDATVVYVSGISVVYHDRNNRDYDFVFELHTKNQVFSLQSDELANNGWDFDYKGGCSVIMRYNDIVYRAMCKPINGLPNKSNNKSFDAFGAVSPSEA